jgi:hypothetical protein
MTDDFTDPEFDADDDPEIMDEFQWEEFMKKSDERTEKYGKLMEKYFDHPDRDKIIAREMGWTWLLDALEAQERGELPEHEEDDYIEEEDEGEEWKKASQFHPDRDEEREKIPAYRIAREFALRAIDFVKTLPEDKASQECVRAFIEGATVPAAKIAGGVGFGFEMETIGGNIANCKRGLAKANQCLTALHEMKEQKIVDENAYAELSREATEMRDALALYITDLRERFQRGIP